MAEHHPDRHVVVEQHGGDRTVLVAEFLVQGSQVLRLGAVEPVEPAGTSAVGGATRRRVEGEVVRTGR